MRAPIVFVLSGIIMSLLLSCVSSNFDYKDFIQGQLFENIPDSQIEGIDTIVIIPRLGCSSCVAQSDKFYFNNRGKKNIIFIFTNLESEKRLRIDIGVTDKNAIIDKNNNFYNPKYAESSYPILLIVKDGAIATVNYLLDVME